METGLTEQLDAFLARELAQDSVRLLEAELRADEGWREEFVLQSQMDAALMELMADENSKQDFAQSVLASVQVMPERALAKSVLSEILDEREAAAGRHQTRAFDWWVWTKTAAIAALAAGVTVWGLQSVRVDPERGGQSAPPAKFFARLTADENAEWAESSLKAREDGWLQSGRLNLLSGQAEVTFGSGARVLLEGPVVFDVEQMNRGFLKRGQLAAEVPGPASGFVINTPLLNVVDLGTRFGLRVKNNGESELHVMQGVVEVSRTRGRSVPLVLTDGLAVMADRRPQSRLRPVVYAGHDFVLPEQQMSVLATAHFLHYGFDEAGGADIDDSGVGLDGGPFDVSLLPGGRQASSYTSPKRTAGVVGRALAFELGDRVPANGPSLLAGGLQAWSMMLWMKVPPKVEANEKQEFVTWGEGDAFWRMSWNDDAGVGVEGALRVDYGNGYVVGATDLRDGSWHHLAVVFIGADGAGNSAAGENEDLLEWDSTDVASHVRLYVNGKLEALSGARSELVMSLLGDALSGSSSLSLGGKGAFEGWLDEFYLFEAAASSASVLELYQMGSFRGGADAKEGGNKNR